MSVCVCRGQTFPLQGLNTSDRATSGRSSRVSDSTASCVRLDSEYYVSWVCQHANFYWWALNRKYSSSNRVMEIFQPQPEGHRQLKTCIKRVQNQPEMWLAANSSLQKKKEKKMNSDYKRNYGSKCLRCSKLKNHERWTVKKGDGCCWMGAVLCSYWLSQQGTEGCAMKWDKWVLHDMLSLKPKFSVLQRWVFHGG